MGGRSAGRGASCCVQHTELKLLNQKKKKKKSASSFVLVDDDMGDNTIIMEFALYAVFLLECVQEF
jgi:hypothetical protein